MSARAVLLAVSLACQAGAAQSLVLAEHGRSSYTIVIAADAAPATRHAADELARFLAEMTGAQLRIETDRSTPVKREILVGASQRSAKLGVELAGLGSEGYRLCTIGERLVIAGSEPRGTLHGVYGLLSEHLGCRWFTPEVSRIPRHERLEVPPLDERRLPAFGYRDVFVKECFDGDWAARNRLNSSHADLDSERGGRIEYQGFVHTFEELVPPERYFASHPEYFSEIGGQRVGKESQLCCTSEDVARIVTEEVRARMSAHPEATIFSVSQNDRFADCQCARCRELSDAEGSAAAPVLLLVNRVAEALEHEFPGRWIDTLAYQWSRHPPRTLRPRANVVVRLCTIECCFAHPLDACPQNRAFVADIEGWARLCEHLWVWDYVTDFAHYLLPFPNHAVLAANLRFFAAHHVTGVFEEGNYTSPHGELQALRGYVLAQCLWDPLADARATRDEFLDAVYGPAAPSLRRYVELLPFPEPSATVHAGIFDGVSAPWLGDLWQESADELMSAAGESVADRPGYRERVAAARLAVDYVAIERARMAGTRADPDLAARVRRFFDTSRAAGLTAVSEGDGGLAEYEGRVRQALGLDAPK